MGVSPMRVFLVAAAELAVLLALFFSLPFIVLALYGLSGAPLP